MDWRSHAFIGAVFALAAGFALGVHDIFGLIFVAVFGALCALVPDLDHDSSKGRQWLDIAAVGFSIMIVYSSGCGDGAGFCVPGLDELRGMIVAFLALCGIYFLFFRFFKPKHRGITHTLAACLVFGVLVYVFTGFQLAVIGLFAYFSHLFADQHIKAV
ncbi:MAG: metal-dependent hydrolase [Candidatus Micrarchaeota archaeon]